MSPEKITFMGPEGRPVEGWNIPVVESIEKFSEVTLEDGTVLLIKAIALTAMRIEGEWDQNGNPKYMVQNNTVIGVKHCPENLRQGGE